MKFPKIDKEKLAEMQADAEELGGKDDGAKKPAVP
jgi:hypothetical protein